jgi:hypothetical protein
VRHFQREPAPGDASLAPEMRHQDEPQVQPRARRARGGPGGRRVDLAHVFPHAEGGRTTPPVTSAMSVGSRSTAPLRKGNRRGISQPPPRPIEKSPCPPFSEQGSHCCCN